MTKIDWSKARYTVEDARGWEYPDFTGEEGLPPWPSKRWNPTRAFNKLHVVDLNRIVEGTRRRMYAVYGIPIGWGRDDAPVEELLQRIREIEAAERSGSAIYQVVLDGYGLIDHEHFVWIKNKVMATLSRGAVPAGDPGASRYLPAGAAGSPSVLPPMEPPVMAGTIPPELGD